MKCLNGKEIIALLVIAVILKSQMVWAQPVQTLTLEESINMALKQSVMIHAAKEGTKGAEALMKEAYTAFLPRFSTSYSYTRLNKTPAFIMPGSPLAPPTTVITGTKDNYNWAVEVRQPLFAGGGLTANYEVSRIGLDIARFEKQTTIQNIVLEVQVAYFGIIKAQRILEVARQARQQLQAHRNVAHAYFNVGLIPKNELLSAEVELANGDLFLVRADHALQLAVARFNTILRRDINMPTRVAEVPSIPDFDRTFEECVKAALENRSEIKMFEARIRQARTMVNLARSEFAPTVSLIGNYSRFGDDFSVSGSRYRDRESWQVTALANWNFWEWGRTGRRVEYKQTRERQAESALVNLREQIVLEVRNAYLQLKEANKQISVAKQAIIQADDNLRISRARFSAQVATSTEVLDAQTRQTRATSDYHNAVGDYHIGFARLSRAMGFLP